MLKRVDWWEKLLEYLEYCKGKQLNWGTFDCCTFICGAITSMTDIDPYKEFRLPYSTQEEAMAAIKKYTGIGGYNKGLTAVVRTIGTDTGATVIEGVPGRGDVCVIKVDDEYVCSICVGDKLALIHKNDGLILSPVNKYNITLVLRYI